MIEVNQNAFNFLSGRLNHLPDFLHSIEIKNICFDSREVSAGDCYVALPSVAKNEGVYIEKAIQAGAQLVICANSVTLNELKNILTVPNVMAFSGALIHEQLGSVTTDMDVVGVTGTNGKSSICYYLAQVLQGLDIQCAVMGTLGYGKWDALEVSGMTTLPLEKLHKVLNILSEDNTAVAMEVSSHGLEQQRLAGVEFESAIFSNLTRDHLDYHGTMEAYGNEKTKLFIKENLKNAIVNIDDAFSQNLLDKSVALNNITYGTSEKAALRFEIEEINKQGLKVRFYWQQQTAVTELPLYGEFNAYNAAAVIAYALLKGFELDQVLTICRTLQPVPGRMQQVIGNNNAPIVLVDYAHTPDALEQVLKSVKHHNQGDIILVVGCGGDRDQGKRPLMGEIAVKFADRVIFTSDNPRSESAEKICSDMTSGLTQKYIIELDRALAIQQAVTLATNNDVVVIAGKGHEDYQEINGQRHYFSDVSAAKKALHLESLS